MTRCPLVPAASLRHATRWQRHARADRRTVFATLLALLLVAALVFAHIDAYAAPTAHPPVLSERDAIAFAVVAGVPQTAAQAPRTQAMLRWIGRQPDVDFIVHLGNLRTSSEPCSDGLFANREAILNATPAPLIFVPGENDWATCSTALGGGDPVERLDALRDSFFSGAMSLGNPGMRLIRQSELPAFRPYRENTRWIEHEVVFVTLNVPAGNNHFSDAGGRNGEFEDREVANRDWITRALTDARRRRAKALVFFFQADPIPLAATRRARSGFAAWFTSRREHDGYAALRRDLRAAAEGFAGPVLVVHTTPVTNPASKGPQTNIKSTTALYVEPLLRPSRNGKPLRNLVHVQLETPTPAHQWLKIVLRTGRGTDTPSIHAMMEVAPAHLPNAPDPTGNMPDDEDQPAGITRSSHVVGNPTAAGADAAKSKNESNNEGSNENNNEGSNEGGNQGGNDRGEATEGRTIIGSGMTNAAIRSDASEAMNAADVAASPDHATSTLPAFTAAPAHALPDMTGAPVYDDGNDGWAGLPEEPHTLVDPSSVLGDISRPVLRPLPPQTTSPLGAPAQ